MRKQITVVALMALATLGAAAQTVVSMPISQNPLFGVSTNRVEVAAPEGGVAIGGDIVVSGGSGSYSYRWYTSDDVTLGTEQTLWATAAGTYLLDIDDTCGCRQTVTFTVTIDISAIGEVGVDVESVYPNPTAGLVNIRGSRATQAAVVSMDGRLVMLDTSTDGSPLAQLDFGPLPSGVYLLTLSNETSHLSVHKILRQ